MSAQHMPGPWFLDSAPDVDLPNHVGISSDKHGLLAQVVWKMDGDERTPRCEANARLIAAAPELLEALLYWKNECSGTEPSISVFNQMVDEVIAKVEGEKQ